MYIFDYDIYINDIFDKIYNNIDINKFTLSNYKKFNVNDFINKNKYNNDINKYTFDLINFNILLICLTNEDNDEDIKSYVIKKKLLDTEKLGSLITHKVLYDNINVILNQGNIDDINKLYEDNLKYKNSIKILNDYGYVNVTTNFKGMDLKLNKHNLIKFIIIKFFYRKFYRKAIFDIIFKYSNKFKKIEVILPKFKILDYNSIESILDNKEIQYGLTTQILNQYENLEKHIIEDENSKIYNLFNSGLVIPIVDDFLRYHKITEKYQKLSTQLNKFNDKVKEQTKIKFITSKIDNIINRYSKKVVNNEKLVNEISKYFWKPLLQKNAIIYNEIEELNIIYKLNLMNKTALIGNELYNELKNYRKHSYIDYKDLRDIGIRHNHNKKLTVARYCSFEHNIKNLKIETRTINNSKKVNIVGLIILNKNKNLKYLNKKNMKDIHTLDNNGYIGCLEVLKNKINSKNISDYYWIFNKNDNTTDELYENNDNIIHSILTKLYDNCVTNLLDMIMMNLSKYSSLDLMYSNYINNYYQKKYFQIKNKEYNNIIKNKIKEIIPINKEYKDENDDKIFGILGKDIYKLPVIQTNKNTNKSYIVVKDIEKDKKLDKNITENFTCQHSIDWANILKLKNKFPNLYQENIYNFIKKYIESNHENQYICKSCKQLVEVESFLSDTFDGGISGINIVLRTFKNLSEIKEYSKFSFLIKNIDKLIERLAQINNFNIYIGNEAVNKMRRQDIIKQVIDIIIIHDKTLRTKNMNKRIREIKAFQNYGINSQYSSFFIFPIDNEIFKFSSDEVDKFKKIKINNIISYILFFMMIDMNTTHINILDFDKSCNIIIFDKIYKTYFKDLKIINKNSGDTIDLINNKPFCYILYSISCMISKFKLWFISNEDKNLKTNIIIQYSIIHTLIDLINNLFEVLQNKKFNYLYDIIFSKFINKFNIFNSSNILEDIREKQNKLISISDSNKLIINKNKIKSVKVVVSKIEYNDFTYRKHCSFYYINRKINDDNKLLPTNLINNLNKKFKQNNLIKLAQIYDDKGIKRKFNLSYEDASKLPQNNLNNMNKIIGSYKIKTTKIKTKHFKERLKNIKINANFNSFLNEISKSYNSFRYNNITYDLNFSFIELSHDFMGNNLNSNIYLNLSDKKIKIIHDSTLNFKIYEIFDNFNKIKLIIDFKTLQYLGYRKGNNFINMKKVNIYCKYIPSIKEIFETLGFKRNFYNFKSLDEQKNTIYKSINYLKKYIRDFALIFNIIKYKNNNSYNSITSYYITRIDNIKLSEFKHKSFNDYDIINKFTYINIQKNSKLENVSKYDIINLCTEYKKLLDYLISELLFIIDINKNKYLKVNIISLILSIAIESYYDKYEQYYNFKLIRYNHIIDSDLISEIKESSIILNEDIDDDKLSEEQKNMKYDQITDLNEKNDSRDIGQESLDDEEIGADNEEDFVEF